MNIKISEDNHKLESMPVSVLAKYISSILGIRTEYMSVYHSVYHSVNKEVNISSRFDEDKSEFTLYIVDSENADLYINLRFFYVENKKYCIVNSGRDIAFNFISHRASLSLSCMGVYPIIEIRDIKDINFIISILSII